MTRKKIIAGNWKMNSTKTEAVALVNGILEKYSEFNLSENKLVVIAVPFPYLDKCSTLFNKFPFMYTAAQNCSEHEQGAYTGEVSAKMILSLDVQYVIIGHSERRQYFNETNEQLLNKIKQAQKQGLIPIFCCGESLEIRENNEHFSFIQSQLENCIFHLSQDEIKNIVVAYEPIWAIGTGKTASPAQAEEIHVFIRNEIAKKYNDEIAANISILYGGSVNGTNANELFSCENIDGGLVGGASLKIDEFVTIIKAMK